MRSYIPAYLIALIGKDERKNVKRFLDKIMPKINDIIKKAQRAIGGQVLYLDCEKQLVSIYEKYGFECFQQNPDEPSLYQMWQTI